MRKGPSCRASQTRTVAISRQSQNIAEVITEHHEIVKHLVLKNVDFTLETWNVLVPALLMLRRLETLKLCKVRLFSSSQSTKREKNVFVRDGLLDEIVDRNPSLASLRLRKIGSERGDEDLPTS